MKDNNTENILSESNLESIFTLLRGWNKLDFSAYKSQTVDRRIARRISMLNLKTGDEYVEYIEEHIEELEALFNDLLIEVTSFFRDSEAFQIIADKILPDLIKAELDAGRGFRAWVPACASGQEAYSIAILLHETFEKHGNPVDFRIFATDISEESINFASAGIYALEMLEGIPKELIEKYFYQVDEVRYRVHPKLRSRMSFIKHNVISDPPFPYIDLISCRNLLIYFKPEIQQQVISTFHFSLNPNGCLFLGSSESLNELAHGFLVKDSRWRIFSKNPHVKLPFEAHRLRPEPISVDKFDRSIKGNPSNTHSRIIDLYDSLMSKLVAPGIIVDSGKEIIHINGDVMKYFPPVKGRLTTNLLEWASGNLKIAISTAINRADTSNSNVSISGIEIDSPAFSGKVVVKAQPFKAMNENYCFLHIGEYEELKEEDKFEDQFNFDLAEDSRERIENLELEVRELQHNLYSALEDKKSSQEELQASNEELRASNEELQSSNEELHAISAEHEKKIRELVFLNNDINNLLKSTDIAAVFLDHELRIRRYTPVAERLLNLTVKDIDRPLLNIRHELIEAEEIKNDAHCVLKADIPVEKELIQSDKRSFLYRILPYKDESDEVRGVVLCFTETTRLRAVESAFIESEARFRAAVEAVNDAVWSYSVADSMFEFSHQWFKFLGVKADRFHVSMDSFLKLVHEDDKPVFVKAFDDCLMQSCEFAIEFRVMNGLGNYIWISSRGRCIDRDIQGKPKAVMGTNSDVSIRKQFELQRHKQQQLISLVCDGIGLGFWNFDLVSETLEVDNVFRAITGFEEFIVSFDEFFSHCHPDDSEQFAEDVERLKKGDIGFIGTEMRIKRGRAWQWVQINGIVSERSSNKLPHHLVGFIEDINRRKLAEQAIKESEARYKQAMQIADLGSWSYELAGKSFRGDDGCSRIFSKMGIARPYSVASISAALSPEYQSKLGNALELISSDFFKEKNLHEFYESFALDSKAGKIYLTVGMNFEYNDKSELTSIRGIIQDITVLKCAEEALKKSIEETARQKEILSGMIENMPIGVLAKNVMEGNKYILCNLEAERILNLSAEEIIGADETIILNQNEAELVKRQDLKVITSKRVVDFGEMTIKVGSQYKEIKKVKIPIFSSNNEVQLIFTLMEDVTDERSLERQLQHSQKMDAVGRLAGGIAHDFNNMLQAIMGYGNLIMESLDSSEENHENSFMILKAAEQARGLVRQLMAFSRKEELVTRSVNIGNLVEDMVKMLSRLIGEHIEIETKIHLSNVGVMADSGQLEQALVNLCLNAKDAMPGGGKLTISAGITRLELEDCSIHADATPGEYALISIQDTGRGIPKEFLEHIFEPFFTTKDLGKGTGLGLATVYAIVNRHDGFLRVDSEEDIGTVFSMYLPIAEDVFTDGKPEESHINVKGGSETVLLAEDEPMVRNFASRILQRAGYKVVEAVDGEEAINLFVSNGGEIDMLVFDVMMPRKNGRDAYNEIEKLHKDIPVLFCSGYGDDLLKTEYNVDVGGRILPKPYKSRELLREVRLILDRMGSNSIKPQL